MGVKEGVGS
jgi:hypothetical protein